MHADLEGAAQIARTAAGFDWTWTRDDVERFARVVGWSVTEVRRLGATLTTGLSVDRPVVNVHFGGNYFSAADETIEDLSVYVADVVPSGDDAVSSDVLTALADLATRVEAELGEPEVHAVEVGAVFSWDFDDVVITLNATHSSVYLDLINPQYQDWLENAPDDEF
ncbi:DUF6301 family protein [Nocardia sp. NPDC051570]|uniref:DUF6301 family protein n=1 Tax=Nocardia sp. NPDC051570 TaxID=3364324 RepID=UPI0037AA7A3D